MSENNYTRRGVLRRVGTTSMAIVPAVSGCLDSGGSTPSETSTSTSNSTSTTTPEPQTNTPAPDAWTEYGPKPYALFSPQPDKLGSSTSNLTCTLPAVARKHGEAFGDAESRFTSSWIETPPGTHAASTYFNIRTNSTLCIGGAFDKEPVIDRFESFSFEKLDPYRGFDVYAGSTSGISLQVNAVQNGWMLMTFPPDIPDGKRKIRHLIDLCLEDVTPYYRSGEPFTDLVEYLPQGVFTRVYPDVSELNLRLPRDRLETAGETLRFDEQYTPATGVVALRFRDDVDNPRDVWRESSEWLTSFMRLSLQDPKTEIRTPSEKTLILEGPVDPKVIFSS